MERHKIGIIGINGQYGTWLADFFMRHGCPVIGSDIGTPITNREVVINSEVVIFAVQISKAVEVIKGVAHFAQSNQLLMDVTGVKAPAVQAMLGSIAEVVGLHPMCAPKGKTFEGHTIVMDSSRVSSYWSGWVNDFLALTHAHIQNAEPDQHDEERTIDQGLPHDCVLAMAHTTRRLNPDMRRIMEAAPPFYQMAHIQMGRILHQKPELYADIQMENPHTLKMLNTLLKVVTRIRDQVARKDKKTFIADFQASKEFFGEYEVERASGRFENIIKQL